MGSKPDYCGLSHNAGRKPDVWEASPIIAVCPTTLGGSPTYGKPAPQRKRKPDVWGASPIIAASPTTLGRRALYECPDGAGPVLYMQVIPDTWIFGRDVENLEDFFAAGG